MATSFPGPQDEGVKTQAAPKMLLVWLIAGIIIVGIITGYVLLHNHGGTSAGAIGQPADQGVGPQLGTEGPATGRSPQAGAASMTTGSGQGGGPGAKGSPGSAGGSDSQNAGATGTSH